MLAEKIIEILDSILEHTINNDVKFQCKKLKLKVNGKRFRKFSDDKQREELYSMIQEIKFGFDTVKKSKLKATDTIYNILVNRLEN